MRSLFHSWQIPVSNRYRWGHQSSPLLFYYAGIAFFVLALAVRVVIVFGPMLSYPSNRYRSVWGVSYTGSW
ncbi:MAG: hypothetical protein ACU4EQ_06915 [Candidatus Nitrosoglobus sp.]